MTWTQTESLTDPQIDELTEMYQHEWWSGGRTRDQVARMLKETPVVIAFIEDSTGRLAAFCRLLSDGVFRAMLLDVIVAREFRERGLGRRLVEAVRDHPRLREIPVVWLCCEPNMVPFYEKWGFEVISDNRFWMHKVLTWPS